MVERLREIQVALLQRWASMTATQRLVAGGILAGVVITLVGGVVLSRHVGYATLYTNLTPEQAGAIVERLDEKDVSYRLTRSGSTIQVPEKLKAGLRLELQMDGTLDGLDGYEILDEGRGLGLTETDRRLRHQRALEGELTRTIRQLQEVVAARVHLVMPERTLFGDPARQPTASVVLQLRPGAQLGKRQVAGIRALVASSVEGLQPERVDLVDASGNLVSSPATEDGFDGSRRYDLLTAVSGELETKAQTLLDRVVGPGESAVRVMAELDFERIDRDVERFDPNGAVVRSEEVNEGTGGASGNSTSQVTNFEINRTVERIQRAPGSIKRLTISVSVDGRRVAGPDGGELVFQPRPAAELQELAALVQNAVGFDPARGDQFHIGCVEFGHDPAQVEHQALQKVERRILVETMVSWGLRLLGLVLVFLLLLRVVGLVSQLMTAKPVALATGGPKPRVAAGEATAPAYQASSGVPAAAAPDAQADNIVQAVTELTRERPADSAAVIRTMLSEEG